MFDGTFRSRKEVNLSGGRSRRKPNNNATQSRQALVRNAEERRKIRQERQRQNDSATLIQKCTRGWLARIHVLSDIWLPQTVADSPSSASPFISTLTATAMCLSLPTLLERQQQRQQQSASTFTSVRQLILRHAQHLSSSSSSSTNQPLQQQQQQQQQQPSSMWVSQQRLVQRTLQIFIPRNFDSNHIEDLQSIFTLLQFYWPTLRIDNRIFLELVTCLASWIQTASNNDNHTIYTIITKTLWEWALQAASTTNLSSPYARPLLTVILLGYSSNGQIASQWLPGDIYTTWIDPLAKALEKQKPIVTSTTYTVDPILQTIWNHLQGAPQTRLLSNLLQRQNDEISKHPSSLVLLFHHALCQNPTGDLALLTSLVVKGDSLEVTNTATTQTTDDTMEDDDDMDDDDDDYNNNNNNNNNTDDVVEMDLDSQRQNINHTTGGRNTSRILHRSSRHSRREFLTIPKLDKLYSDQIQLLKRNCKCINATPSSSSSSSSNTAATTMALAKDMARAPWLAWGLGGVLDENNNNNKDMDAANRFVECLAILLQATTSLRPRSTVGVLSHLAFNKTFQTKLWNYCRRTGSELGMVVFCDLFAHYLVALSDLDFLSFHTRAQDNSNPGVGAADLVEHLRNILHDLYWTNPVLVHEVSLRHVRGRLLLSGTKVWNALHERWTRLERSYSFCDESLWWFPNLEDSGAFASESRQLANGSHNNVPNRDDGGGDGGDDMDMDDNNNDSDDDNDNGRYNAASAETDALADAFRDPKLARILTCIPQALPFGGRVKLFHSLLSADKKKSSQSALQMFLDGSVREQIRIRRAHLYEDSMQQLNELGPRLKRRVQVSFVNKHGMEEAGIDGGGVFKEFLDDLIKNGFAIGGEEEGEGENEVSPTGGPPLFSVTPNQTLAVNFDFANDPSLFVHYEFLGRVLGKAVYEGILVEPQFCLPFLNQLLGKHNHMEDLKNYDEEYYKNLNKLKLLNDSEIEALGLTFEMTIGGQSAGSRPRTVDLIPHGSTIPVKNKAHIFSYMHGVSNQLLNVQGARQTRAFLRGFRDLIPAPWVRLFSASELQKVIGGDDSVRGIDVPSLKRVMTYLGGYHPDQPYVQDFWDVIENDLTPDQQRKFLRFMTSCSRQPLLGFASLEPVPAIQQIRLTPEELSKNSKLPTSQTCFNLLKLPNYKDKALLKKKLLAAIESGAGFELT